MTREEAILNLILMNIIAMQVVDNSDFPIATNMAIKALEEPCEDCISRADVINTFCQICQDDSVCFRDKDSCADLKLFRELPSVQLAVTPQPKTGKWIFIGNSDVNGLKICECDVCGKRTYGSHNFCPNCGEKMIEPQECEE